MEITSIQVEKKVLRELKKVKKYERQTYSELLMELVNFYKNVGAGQYDKFLDMAQQDKIRELWGNKDDEAWENA